VLQVRMAWTKLAGGLVSPADMSAGDGVKYAPWLDRFTVRLKVGRCRLPQSNLR